MRRTTSAFAGTARALSAVLAVLSLLACASGTVQTAAGPRPAAEVQAQNEIGRFLGSLERGYADAVKTHNSRKSIDTADEHARSKATLDGFRAGLDGSLRSLAAWKLSTSGGSTAEVLSYLRPALGSYLELAVRIGVLKQGDVDAVLAFVSAAFRSASLTSGPTAPALEAGRRTLR